MNNNRIDIHFIDNNINEFYELLSVFSKVFEWEEEKYPNKDYLVKLLEKTSFLFIFSFEPSYLLYLYILIFVKQV